MNIFVIAVYMNTIRELLIYKYVTLVRWGLLYTQKPKQKT